MIRRPRRASEKPERSLEKKEASGTKGKRKSSVSEGSGMTTLSIPRPWVVVASSLGGQSERADIVTAETGNA